MNKKFFKDPKIKTITCKEFFLNNNFLLNCTDENKWSNIIVPLPYIPYYHITDNLLIKVVYNFRKINYGLDLLLNLGYIEVAFRNGINEYECFNSELEKLKFECLKHPKSKKLPEQLKFLEKNLKNIKKKLPPFTEIYKINTGHNDFKKYLIFNLYKSKDEKLSSDYVVLDIETNGLRKSNDDILSISIYDPYKGIAFNRYLPLELQPIVLTKYIHGISEDKIKNEIPLTQMEFDDIVNFFNLKQRTILTYSGGKFDYEFLSKYFKRHNIQGLENLLFKNIKDIISSNSDGNLTKDNLCKILNIDGFSDFHTSLNDCILEWKLFEKIYPNKLIAINGYLYELSNNYILPASYLLNYVNLAENLNIKLPKTNYKFAKMYEYQLPKNILSKIKKFDTNISGIEIEHIINSLLKAKECDNTSFLTKNKQKLKLLGSLGTKYQTIIVTKNDDGTFSETLPENKLFVEKLNDVSSYIKTGILPVINFIKQNIFKRKEIRSQELVFSNNNKVFSLCDLSDKYSVLEIKAYDVISSPIKSEKLVNQLLLQSKGRKMYTLSIDFRLTKYDNLQDIFFKIYEIKIPQ